MIRSVTHVLVLMASVAVVCGCERSSDCALGPKASCPGADLREKALVRADLSGADLSRADLSSANLQLAQLPGANLSGANLSSASLDTTNLKGADLSGANLTGANLSRAWLQRAKLDGARLDGVRWAETWCPDDTKSDTHGETCTGHLNAPSYGALPRSP